MEIFSEILKIGGPGALAIVILYFIVKRFLESQEKQEKRFIEIIENHLKHNTGIMNNLKESIKELCVWLKRNNK